MRGKTAEAVTDFDFYNTRSFPKAQDNTRALKYIRIELNIL